MEGYLNKYLNKYRKWTCKSAEKQNGQAVNTAKGNMLEQEDGLSDELGYEIIDDD